MQDLIMNKLVTVIEVAKKFGVHVETVRRWVRSNKIPYFRPTSHTIRFDLAKVEKTLAKPMKIDRQ